MKLPQSFLDKALEERSNQNLECLTWEMINFDHSERYPNMKILAMKKSEIGALVVVDGVGTEPYISVSQYDGIFWWHEGPTGQSLIKKIEALPNLYPEVLPEPEMDLDEIHAFQALVDAK